MKLTHLLLSASVLAVTAAPVLAEGNTIFSGNSGVTLKFSGQINRGILLTDDGVDTESFFVDNDNSSSRFKISAEGAISDGLRAGLVIEIEAESNSSATVTQDMRNINDETFLNPRKLEFYFDGDSLGRVTVGMGNTASNEITEIDLSGTAVVGYSGVEDAAGGIQFRDGDENLSGVTVGGVFTNLDGLSRQDRLRYDTPNFGGFTFSASAGVAGSGEASDEIYDIAARYAGDFGSYKVSGGIAYAMTANEDEIVSGSVSMLHKDTGLSVTLAGGVQDYDDNADDRDTTFGYIKRKTKMSCSWMTKPPHTASSRCKTSMRSTLSFTWACATTNLNVRARLSTISPLSSRVRGCGSNGKRAASVILRPAYFT